MGINWFALCLAVFAATYAIVARQRQCAGHHRVITEITLDSGASGLYSRQLRVDPERARIVIEAGSSPDLMSWLARAQGLLAVGSGADPGRIYRTLDPITKELVWRNDKNRFGTAIQLNGAEEDARFRELLAGTELTSNRLVFLLIPSGESLVQLELLLEENGILPSTPGMEIHLGIHLLDPHGMRILQFKRLLERVSL